MLRINNVEKIIKLIEDKSISMTEYVLKSENSRFVLYYKYLTHSDLPTFGKATKPNNLHKNILYYLTVDEMKEVEKKDNKNFETAHQSNIGLPASFWDDIGMKNPRETVGSDDATKNINKYVEVLLVNDSLKYFNLDYTSKVIH